MLMIKSNKGFFNNQGDVTQRQMIQSGQVTKSFDFICVQLVCKFQGDPIKTEQVMLMTSHGEAFSAIRRSNSKIPSQSGQFFNSFEISSMSILFASYR